MNENLRKLLISTFEGKEITNKFSVEQTEEAAFNALLEELQLTRDSSLRDIRAKEAAAFAIIEQTVDEILPKKLQGVLQEFAEVKTFGRNDEVVFDIAKLGKNRAKLTISKGARGGLYRAARYSSTHFSVTTSILTAGVNITLEEIIAGKITLGELWNNILEGFQEGIYKEVFNALAVGVPVAGYNRITGGLTGDGTAGQPGPDSGSDRILTVKADLGKAIDAVMPYVRQYGNAMVFGSYQALSVLENPTSEWHPEMQDSAEKRNFGHISIYKGARLVELPNYLIDNTNKEWFYDPSYVFVLPVGVKPVKIALKGETLIQRNTEPTGDERWDANKLIGVGIAMANNFAVIKVSDIA